MIEVTDAGVETPEELKLDRPFYAPSDVATMAAVSTSTILNWIRSGRLAAVYLSERTIRIPRRSVQKLLSPETVFAPRRVRLEDIPLAD